MSSYSDAVGRARRVQPLLQRATGRGRTGARPEFNVHKSELQGKGARAVNEEHTTSRITHHAHHADASSAAALVAQ